MQRITNILFLCFFCIHASYAQDIRAVDFFVNIDQFPRSYAELMAVGENYSLEAFNNTDKEIEFYLEIEVFRDGIRYAYTDMNYTEIILSLLPNESKTFTSSNLDIFPESLFPDHIFPAELRQASINTFLDEGEYVLCVKAFTTSINGEKIQISEGYPITCSEPFIVMHDAQAIPFFPTDCVPIMHEDDNEEIVFDWGFLLPDDQLADYEYVFKLVEITDANWNSFDYLFADGVPAVVEEIVNINEYRLEPAGVLEPEKNYAWRVETRRLNSPQGDPESNNFYSEILEFVYSQDCSEEEEEEVEEFGNVNQNFDCKSCLAAAPDDQIVSSAINNLGGSFYAGYYSVYDIEDSNGNNQSGFSGKGKVRFELFGIDNIPVKVEFFDVKLNSDSRMVEGEVKSILEDINEFDITLAEDVNFTLTELKNQSPAQYDDLVSSVKTLSDVANDLEDITNNGGLEMPLGFDQSINGENYKLMIDQMRFLPEGASINISLNFPVPFIDFDYIENEEGDFVNDAKYIAITVKELCITPDGSFGPGSFPLVDNIKVLDGESHDDFALTLNGCLDCDDRSKGTFVSFDCDGITACQLDMNILFSDEILIPVIKEEPTPVRKEDSENPKAPSVSIDNRVTGNFKFYIGKEGDYKNTGWLSTLSLSPFQLSFLEDWTFEVQEASLDMSLAHNASGMVIPEGHSMYTNEENEPPIESDILNRYTGVYINKVNITPPPEIRGNVLSAFSAGNTMMEFGDQLEFSSFIGVDNPFGNYRLVLGDWSSELSRIGINILQNDFKNGAIKGKLYSPLLHQDDYFDLSGLITPDLDGSGTDYSFSVSIGNEENENADVRIPLLLAASEIKKESHVTITYDDDLASGEDSGFNFDMKLAGKIYVDGESLVQNNIVPSSMATKTKNFPFKLVGLPYVLAYNKKDKFKGSYFGFNAQQIALIEQNIENSLDFSLDQDEEEKEQQNLGGFSFQLEKFEIGGTLNNPKITIAPHVSFMSDGSSGDGIGAGATIWIESRFDDDRKRYIPSDFGLECISIESQNESFAFTGGICYKTESGIKRFDGDVSVKLPTGTKIGLEASFGTVYKDLANNNVDYNFWRFQGVANLQPSGIPLGPIPVSLMAFGGGMSYKMRRKPDDLSNTNIDVKPSGGQSSRQKMFAVINNAGQNAIQYEPSKNRGVDFNLGLVFAPTGSAESFNFGGVYTKEGSRKKLIGDFYVMSPIDGNPDKTILYGELDLNLNVYSFRDGLFKFESNLTSYLKFPPRRTSSKLVYGSGNNNRLVSARFKIDNKYDHYYIHAGSPFNPGGVKFGLAGIDVSRVDAYFMAGTSLPTSITLPPLIKDILAKNSRDNSGNYRADLGGLSRSSLENNQRPINDGTGIAFGVQAKTELSLPEAIDKFVDLNVDIIAGFDLNLTRSEGRRCNGEIPGYNKWYAMGQIYAGFRGNLKLFSKQIAYLGVVSYVQAGFPNPTWINGELDVTYSLPLGPILDFKAEAWECGAAVLTDVMSCAGHVGGEAVEWVADGIGSLFGADDVVDIDILDCDIEAVQKECVQAVLDGDFFDGTFKGYFDLPLRYNHREQCDYTYVDENGNEISKPFGDFEFIKNITPGEDATVSYNLDKIVLETTISTFGDTKIPYYSSSSTPDKNVNLDILDFSLAKIEGGMRGIPRSYSEVTDNKYRHPNGLITNLVLEPGDLEPDSEYLIRLNIEVRYTEGGRNKSFTSYRGLEFKTEKIPDKIEHGVLASFPGKNQLHLHVEDVRKGWIKFDQFTYDNYFGNSFERNPQTGRPINTNHDIIITNISDSDDSHNVSGLNASSTDKGFTYDFPSLRAGELYELSIIRNFIYENKTVEVYSYYFQTSKHASFEDKIAAAQVINTSNKTYLKCDEHFDAYDKSSYQVGIKLGAEYGSLLQTIYDIYTDKILTLENTSVNLYNFKGNPVAQYDFDGFANNKISFTEKDESLNKGSRNTYIGKSLKKEKGNRTNKLNAWLLSYFFNGLKEIQKEIEVTTTLSNENLINLRLSSIYSSNQSTRVNTGPLGDTDVPLIGNVLVSNTIPGLEPNPSFDLPFSQWSPQVDISLLAADILFGGEIILQDQGTSNNQSLNALIDGLNTLYFTQERFFDDKGLKIATNRFYKKYIDQASPSLYNTVINTLNEIKNKTVQTTYNIRYKCNIRLNNSSSKTIEI